MPTFTSAEMHLQPFWRLLPDQDIDAARAHFGRLEAGDFPSSYEHHWVTRSTRVTRDGGLRLIAWTNTALLDEIGEPLHIIATGIDVTEQRQTEEHLRQQRRFTEALLETLDTGIVACDGDGTLTLLNRATREMHGHSESPVSPEHWSEHFDLYHADGRTPLAPDEVPLRSAAKVAEWPSYELSDCCCVSGRQVTGRRSPR